MLQVEAVAAQWLDVILYSREQLLKELAALPYAEGNPEARTTPAASLPARPVRPPARQPACLPAALLTWSPAHLLTACVCWYQIHEPFLPGMLGKVPCVAGAMHRPLAGLWLRSREHSCLSSPPPCCSCLMLPGASFPSRPSWRTTKPPCR